MATSDQAYSFDLAAIAHNLGIDLAPMSYAAYLETIAVVENRKRLEELGARIGLSKVVMRKALDEEAERARLLAQAYKFLTALIPHEAEIRHLLEDRAAA